MDDEVFAQVAKERASTHREQDQHTSWDATESEVNKVHNSISLAQSPLLSLSPLPGLSSLPNLPPMPGL
jgi:hypothetical protein